MDSQRAVGNTAIGAERVRTVVLPELVRRLRAIPAVEAVYLYGSRARGDAASRSDIDLAIRCPYADARQWSEALRCLEEPPITLLSVTAVRLDRLDSKGEFYRNIEEDRVVLYEKEAD